MCCTDPQPSILLDGYQHDPNGQLERQNSTPPVRRSSISPSRKHYLPIDHPIPPHPHGHAVRSEEVVPGPGELAVDLDVAVSTDEALVTQLQALIPPSTVGAGLRSTRLGALKDMTSGIAR